MPVRRVRTIPDPILYKKSLEVDTFDRELRSLANDMFDTMYAEDGVGLAAVQIGILKRILVIDLREPDTKHIFVNPKLLKASEEKQQGEEGCLSVPGIAAFLERPRWVQVSYQNILGEEKKIEAENLMARALLHEMDHLDGKIYVDLLEPHIRKKIDPDLNNIQNGRPVTSSKVPEYRKRIIAERR